MDTYIIANRTDVGKERMVNEDSMVTFDSPNGRVIAVCDGMGGQAAGDVASRLACDIITDILENNTFSSPEEAITRSITAANQGILHRASQDPQLEGMGATCVMLIIKDGLVHYGWVGDSRIYYVTKSGITQLSRDQSYVQQLVNSGQITREEAEHHPQKNEILNALGIPTMTPPELSPTPITPEPGSVFVLCSDGLSGMVSDEIIETIVNNSNMTLQHKADSLVNRANENGGLDNITVQLVQFGKEKLDKAGGKGILGLDMKTIYIAIAVIVVVFLGIFIAVNLTKKDEPAKAKSETVDNRKEERHVAKPTVEVKQAPAPQATQKTKDQKKQKQKGDKKKSTKAVEEKNKEANKPKGPDPRIIDNETDGGSSNIQWRPDK